MGAVGEVAHLLPTMDIMNRVYFNTIAPKSGNFDQIHAWTIDLMMHTFHGKDTYVKLDVMDYIRREMWLAIVERRSAPYAPYVQHLINRKFFQATNRRLDQEMSDSFQIHKPISLKIKPHQLPRTAEERAAAEATEAATAQAAQEAGIRVLRAHAATTVPPPSPPMQQEHQEPSWLGRMMDKMRSFCFKKDLEDHMYKAHVEGKKARQRQKTMMKALNAPVSPDGSEHDITPPEQWKSHVQWSDDEEEAGGTPPSWAGAFWDV